MFVTWFVCEVVQCTFTLFASVGGPKNWFQVPCFVSFSDPIQEVLQLEDEKLDEEEEEEEVSLVVHFFGEFHLFL